jgi:uncharacterized OsmC-like protein
MNAEQLRAIQAPIKAHYSREPVAALVTLSARSRLGEEGVTCRVETGKALVEAGLHPATGGDALVACAGVTLRAVATAIEVPVRGGTIRAEGDIDFRGTLGVSKDVPVGFVAIRLRFDLETDASPEQLATLIKLTERYCVVYQTLRTPPRIDISAAQGS